MLTRSISRIATALGLFAVALSPAACGGDSPSGPAAVEAVAISASAPTVVAGETLQLTATTMDARSNPLPGRAVVWSSDNPAVARVEGSGLVRGVAVGSATISAASEGRTGTMAITVTPVPVASLSIEPGAPAIFVGATATLAITARDAAGNVLAGRAVTLTTSDAAVASVTGNVVTGVAPGTATLTAAAEGKTATAVVTVALVPVATVAVTPATANLTIGEARQFSATARDAGGNLLGARAIAWSSSNPAVASVSASGMVTAVAAGRATISATVEGKVGTSTVTVVTPVGGIISSNTTWTRASSPYRLTQNVQIAHGATLTIEAGVEVQGAGRNIEVWGVLSAAGTASSRVRLDSTHVVPRGKLGEPFQIRMQHVEMHRGSLYAATGTESLGNLHLRDSRLTDQGAYMYIPYPVGETFIERNVFVRSGGISVGADTRTQTVRVYIRNNAFVDWTAPFGESFAVQNWASYGGETTIVQHNSFLSTDRVALRLPVGYADGRLTATENYWGTTSESVIQSMIFDRNDDLRSGSTIVYTPFLTQPHASTPAP